VTASQRTPNDAPLAGVRVLDLSRILAGPICTQLLADLGAEVVKVERPGAGDDTRQWGPPFLPDGGPSAYYLSCNRGKRSLALDLSTAQGRATLDALVGNADALVENFLPEAVGQFGLEPARLRQLNPRLVSCSISAFGRTGPLAERPGYDLMVQAMSGLMGITGEPDRMPMKVGVAITDVVTGLYAAASVLAGLVAAGRGASGRSADVALADCTLASLVNVAQSTLLTGAPPKRWGNAHPQIVPYEVFATSDGWLAVAIGADRQWRRFCDAVGHGEWGTDPRYVTNPERVAHRGELIPQLNSLLAERSTASWQKLLDSIDVPHSPVVSLDEAVKAPQVTARGMINEVVDGEGRRFRLLGNPIHWDGEGTSVPGVPPELGEHTDAVLREWLGYNDARIAGLRTKGVIA
jgi:crotonobetainyl-CoA:carnitine CoA-transferase CaiB-like acyl-CoA transferase